MVRSKDEACSALARLAIFFPLGEHRLPRGFSGWANPSSRKQSVLSKFCLLAARAIGQLILPAEGMTFPRCRIRCLEYAQVPVPQPGLVPLGRAITEEFHAQSGNAGGQGAH